MTKHKIMNRDEKLIECAYQIEDSEMTRRITTRTDLYLILMNGNRYRLDTFASAKIVVRFDSGNDICCDCYGQHWYHSLITDDSLAFPYYDRSDPYNDINTFQNYFFRRGVISEEDVRAVMDIEPDFNYCLVNERLPEELLPLIYYDGEGDYILVAMKSE